MPSDRNLEEARNAIFSMGGSSRGSTFQTRLRGDMDQEYQIYLSCADDGKGGDITNGGKPLKTYDEWLNS